MGYTTVEHGDTWTLLGVNFASLGVNNGNVEGKFSIQDLTGDFADGDQIQVWNGSGYEVLYYYSANLLGPTAGFYTDQATLSDLLLPRGTAIWVKSETLTKATVSGKVASSTIPVKGHPGWSLFASRSPVATPVNDFNFSGLSDGDQMQIWDGNGYVLLYWYSEGVLGASGFYESTGELSTRTVPVGSGFWIKSQNEITLN